MRKGSTKKQLLRGGPFAGQTLRISNSGLGTLTFSLKGMKGFYNQFYTWEENIMTGKVRAHRYHDICAGHRVHEHESKCAHLHGHNYRFHFTIEGEQDKLGRVMDFSIIKEKLCMWLEDNWDHRFIVGAEDPMKSYLQDIDPQGVIVVPFNPTAENMAKYLVEHIGPEALAGTNVTLIEVKIEETAKCWASYEKGNNDVK